MGSAFTEELRNKIGPIIEQYFRSEVTGLEFLPATGAALVVSNHLAACCHPTSWFLDLLTTECSAMTGPFTR